MAANTCTIPKSGDEFNSEISELNQCIEELDRMIKELLKHGGDRTEEEAEKLNDAIEFFNGKQEEVKNKLREFEVLGAFANGTRTLQISDMNSFFEELDGKVTEYLPGEIKKKREMQQGGRGESSSTNVPDDDDPGYSQNIQSKRELNILKETMKTCTEIVEIILRSMTRDSASLLPNQNVAKCKLEESHIGESGKELDLKVNETVNQRKNCDSINTELDLEILGANVGAEVSKASCIGGESSGLTSKDETNIEGFDLGDDTTSSEEMQSDSAGNVVNEEEEEEAGEVENEGDDTSSLEDANENDPMNNTIESSLYTNIPGLAEEMNELMRKLEEEDT